MIDFKVVSAIFRKDLRQYLGNPTGYIFLTLFIAATAAAAFLLPGFFSRNLADLAELNRWMPTILMLFVPAVTMGAWADERKSGTDEFLLTLPVRDVEVLLGKYLGALGMYTVSLGFSIAHLFVLEYLGEPDAGLMASTYFGYWLMGAFFCAIGVVASMLTSNVTVGFILGFFGCLGLVMTGSHPVASGLFGSICVGLVVALTWFAIRGDVRGTGIAGLIGVGATIPIWLAGPSGDAESTADPSLADNWFIQTFDMLSVERHFTSLGEGVVRIGDVLYFASGVVVMLYLGSFLLGRRHW